MRLLIGATQLTEPGPGAQVRLIERLLVHKEYSPADQSNDIALLELNEPVQCSSYIQLACVPNATVNVAQLESCYVAGWGATSARCEFPKMEGKLNTLGRWVGLPDSRGQSHNKAAHSLKAGSRDRELQHLCRGTAKPWGRGSPPDGESGSELTGPHSFLCSQLKNQVMSCRRPRSTLSMSRSATAVSGTRGTSIATTCVLATQRAASTPARSERHS